MAELPELNEQIALEEEHVDDETSESNSSSDGSEESEGDEENYSFVGVPDFSANKIEMTWNQIASLNGEAIRLLEDRAIDQVPTVNKATVEMARLIGPHNEITEDNKEKECRVKRLEELMRKHPELSSERDCDERTPLLQAIMNRAPLAIITPLVEAFDHQCDLSSLCIHIAASDESYEAYGYLLDKLVDYCRARELDEILKLVEGHLDSDSLNLAERLLAEFPDIAKEMRDDDEDPFLLHFLVREWAAPVPLRLIELVVSYYPQALVIPNDYGETPLHRACADGTEDRVEIYSLLVTAEAARLPDRKGNLPIHLYLTWKNEPILQVVQLLVDAYPEGVGRKGYADAKTPLLEACNKFAYHVRYHPIIHFMVERCPKALKEPCALGWTPFHVLCKVWDDVAIIQSMVEACPGCVETRSRNGMTPLHCCCMYARHRHVPVVLYLAEMYPDALQMTSDEGRTPLDEAIKYMASEQAIVALAKKCPDLLESIDDDKRSRLHRFCDKGHPRAEERWVLSVLETLACSEKIVLAKDSLGRTPLHLLCGVCRFPEELKVLIDKCPSSANARDDKGRTPLHSAILARSSSEDAFRSNRIILERVVACLIKAYPDAVFAADHDRITPLMLASERNECVSLIHQLVSVNPARLLGMRSNLGKRKRGV